MLPRQCLGPGSLPALYRDDYRLVLRLRTIKCAPKRRYIRLLVEEGAGGGEGQAGHPLDLAADRSACERPQSLVKGGVEFDIAVELHLGLVAPQGNIQFREEPVQLGQ